MPVSKIVVCAGESNRYRIPRHTIVRPMAPATIPNQVARETSCQPQMFTRATRRYWPFDTTTKGRIARAAICHRATPSRYQNSPPNRGTAHGKTAGKRAYLLCNLVPRPRLPDAEILFAYAGRAAAQTSMLEQELGKGLRARRGNGCTNGRSGLSPLLFSKAPPGGRSVRGARAPMVYGNAAGRQWPFPCCTAKSASEAGPLLAGTELPPASVAGALAQGKEEARAFPWLAGSPDFPTVLSDDLLHRHKSDPGSCEIFCGDESVETRR